MFKKIMSSLLVGMFLIFTQGHSAAAALGAAIRSKNIYSKSRVLRELPKKLPKELPLVIGAGLAGKQFCKERADAAQHMKKLEEFNAEQKIIRPEIRAEIEAICKERGIDLRFVIYVPDYFPIAAAASSGPSKGGILIGPKFEYLSNHPNKRWYKRWFSFLWKGNEKECLSNIQRFVIGHEATHIKYDDLASRQAINAGANFAPFVVWRLARGAGRGRIVSALAAFSEQVFAKVVLKPFIFRQQELRADREAIQKIEELEAIIDTLKRRSNEAPYKSRQRQSLIVNKKDRLYISTSLDPMIRILFDQVRPAFDVRIAQLEKLKAEKFGK